MKWFNGKKEDQELWESYTADNDDLFRVTQGYIDEVKVSESKLELAVNVYNADVAALGDTDVLIPYADSKGNWHLTGKPAGKGSVSIPVYVYGKKFNLKIKVKS